MTTPTCCDRACPTPFCPHCGGRVATDHSLASLVVMLRSEIKQFRKTAHRRESSIARQPDDYRHRRWVKELKAADESAAQWQAWADALAQLLDQAGDKKPGDSEESP